MIWNNIIGIFLVIQTLLNIKRVKSVNGFEIDEVKVIWNMYKQKQFLYEFNYKIETTFFE